MTRKKQSHRLTFLWRRRKVSKFGSAIALWLVIVSGTCWQQAVKARWAWACYPADMEKRSYIAPEHFGFILIRKTCCCTWNYLGFQASKEGNAGEELWK